MAEALQNMYTYLSSQIKSIGVTDVVDILIVAVVMYYIFRFVQDRRASKLAVGLVLLFILYLISDLLSLNTIKFIMDNIFQVGLIAVIIVFQPEMRSMLESFGGQTKRLKSFSAKESKSNVKMVEEICRAADDLSADCTGALIVMQRSTPLGDYINSGTIVNADISSILLRNIFFNKSPLHDGAVIIRDGRIHAAGCFLPLTMKTEIMKELGTRHRAAIGASENSDALVIVVSEETGTISVASDGKLRRGFTRHSLEKYLTNVFVEPSVKKTKSKKKNEQQPKSKDETESDQDTQKETKGDVK
ncbi:MAG: TIGR00159 family protein [Clostridiales bacterium]|nr:TIGR00159 family protein [Clostridiales bacterium]